MEQGLMRILIAGAVLQSGWPGGEPMVARSLLAAMEQTGHEVSALSFSRRGASLASLGATPLDADPVAVAHYSYQLGQLRPDLVYGFFDYDSSLLVACQLRSIPFIACVHIHWPACPIGTLYIEGKGLCPGPSWGRCVAHMAARTPPIRLGAFADQLPPLLAAGAFLKFRTRHALLSSASAIIVPSEDARLQLEKAGFDRVRTVYNGIDVGATTAAPWSGGAKSVLFAAGQGSERKGFDDFHRLAERLKPSFPTVTFRATNFKGDAVVEGTPYLPRGELQRLMGASYLVVVPALWDEPFGFVAVEAMALGKPVVCYSAGALPEIVQDDETGIVVPRGSVERLSEAVRRLLLDERLALQFGTAGRREAGRRFSVNQMVRGYLEIGEQIVSQAETPMPRAPDGR